MPEIDEGAGEHPAPFALLWQNTFREVLLISKVTGYEELAHAIILQAVKDYRKALRALSVDPANCDAQAMKSEVEQFFCSSWFKVLTHTSSKRMMHELQREVAA